MEVGVKYARAANPTTTLLAIHFSMHVIDVPYAGKEEVMHM